MLTFYVISMLDCYVYMFIYAGLLCSYDDLCRVCRLHGLYGFGVGHIMDVVVE